MRKLLSWKWRYQSTEAGLQAGRGKLFTRAQPNQRGFYRVKAIEGVVDGAKIDELLPAGTGIPGNVDPVTGTPYVGDNLIRRPRSNNKQPQLSSRGLVFSLEDASYVNLFHGNFPPSPSDYAFQSCPPYPDGPVEPNTESLIAFSARITGFG
jgi:hypothetical protein